MKFLVDNKVAEDLSERDSVHCEHLLESVELERFVLFSSTVQECLQSSLLKCVGQVLFELISVVVQNLSEQIDREDTLNCVSPVAGIEGSCCLHDVVFVGLSSQVECLVVVVLDQALECARNWRFGKSELVLR